MNLTKILILLLPCLASSFAKEFEFQFPNRSSWDNSRAAKLGRKIVTEKLKNATIFWMHPQDIQDGMIVQPELPIPGSGSSRSFENKEDANQTDADTPREKRQADPNPAGNATDGSAGPSSSSTEGTVSTPVPVTEPPITSDEDPVIIDFPEEHFIGSTEDPCVDATIVVNYYLHKGNKYPFVISDLTNALERGENNTCKCAEEDAEITTYEGRQLCLRKDIPEGGECIHHRECKETHSACVFNATRSGGDVEDMRRFCSGSVSLTSAFTLISLLVAYAIYQ